MTVLKSKLTEKQYAEFGECIDFVIGRCFSRGNRREYADQLAAMLQYEPEPVKIGENLLQELHSAMVDCGYVLSHLELKAAVEFMQRHHAAELDAKDAEIERVKSVLGAPLKDEEGPKYWQLYGAWRREANLIVAKRLASLNPPAPLKPDPLELAAKAAYEAACVNQRREPIWNNMQEGNKQYWRNIAKAVNEARSKGQQR